MVTLSTGSGCAVLGFVPNAIASNARICSAHGPLDAGAVESQMAVELPPSENLELFSKSNNWPQIETFVAPIGVGHAIGELQSPPPVPMHVIVPSSLTCSIVVPGSQCVGSTTGTPSVP